MALINKNGQTPAESQVRDELLTYLEQISEEQRSVLERLMVIENKLTNQQAYIDAIPDTFTTTLNNESLYQIGYTCRKVKILLSYMAYLLIGIVILGILLLLSHYILANKISATQGIGYAIESLLQKDTSFWYDEENHQLYIKSRQDS